MLMNCKQVFGIIKCLCKYRKYAVSLGAFLFANALCHFFLEHAAEYGNAIFPFQGFEYDLGGNVVREIANYTDFFIVVK